MSDLELQEKHAWMILEYAEMEEEGLLEVRMGLGADDFGAEPDPIGLGTRLTEAGVEALAATDPDFDPTTLGAAAVLALRRVTARRDVKVERLKEARRQLADLKAGQRRARRELRRFDQRAE